MEVSPGRALSMESSHGREKGITSFKSAGVGKQTNHNRHCEVLFTNPRSLAPQSPAGTRSGLGSAIENQVGRLNYTPG